MFEGDTPPRFIERAYRVRLKLTRELGHNLHRLFEATHHVWNWALEIRNTIYRERGEKLNCMAP